MNRRLILSVLCLASLGVQLWGAETPAAAGNSTPGNTVAVSADDLQQLKSRIAEQQEQIKKLQLAVEEQQKMLERSLQNAAASAAAPATTDGTPVVAASASPGDAVKIVPAVNVSSRDIVRMPRSLQGEMPKASPLSVSIGNSTFTPLGFMDLILYARSTNTGTGTGTGYASIPYNNTPIDHLSELNMSSQNSRIGFRVDSTFKGAKVLGYFEMDFLGNQPAGIFQTSNGNVFRMRNVFVDIQKGAFEILGGQDWSMMTPTKKGLSPIPGDIFFTQNSDTNYISGLTWARQSQVRFVAHASKAFTMGLSLENPQQFIGGAVTLPPAFSTALATQLNNGATNYTAANVHPDVIFKVAADAGALHVEAGGLFRTFKIATSAGTPVLYTSHSTSAASGEVNANIALGKNFHLIANTFFGDGGGRYIGGTGPDLIVGVDGSIRTVTSYSTVDGFEANLGKNTLLYGYYSGSLFERTFTQDPTTFNCYGYGFGASGPLGACKNGGSALNNNKTIQEGSFGLNQTFWKNPNYGAVSSNFQYSYVLRNPWFIPTLGPRETHTNLFYATLRYTLP